MELEEHVRVRLVGGKQTPDGKQRMHYQLPGVQIPVYGHMFIVQDDLELEMDMHRDFVPGEIAAGRIIIVDKASEQRNEKDREAEATKAAADPKLTVGADPAQVDADGFSMDMMTYFGTGSIELLKVRLEKLRPKSKIIDFINSRYNIRLCIDK